MLDPHDDTDVPSGSPDGALMENTSFHVPRQQDQLDYQSEFERISE